MVRRMVLVAGLLLILPALLLAQDGKLRGRVADKESGDPLLGANVVLEGTTIGASTDLNGDYVILGVAAGVYSMKVTYIGYQPIVISNVRVSANLTTSQDFKLAPTPIEVEAVQVVADRPLIQRNTTNTVRLTTQEDIQSLPVRGLQNLVALNAGTVKQDGNLHIRGGRMGEVAYFIDGATATNPFFNSENITVIQEAMEEIQMQAGGYTAEFGGANSGIVRTSMRSGSDKFNATLDARTDDFAKPGEQFLNTSSFGIRNIVLTLNGPVPMVPKARFFVAAQHNYIRDRDTRIIVPFRFEGLVTDGAQGRPAGVPLPGPVEFERNYLPDNHNEDNTVQGTLTYDWSPVKFRLTGNYEWQENPVGRDWPAALQNFYNHRDPMQERRYALLNLKATHVLNPKTFYEMAVSYTNRSFRQFDPDFGDQWQLYPDSVESAKLGYHGFRNRYLAPLPFSTISGFVFADPNAPNLFYSRNNQTSIGAAFDFTSQVTPVWELKAGARFDRWTMRLYQVNNASTVMSFLYGSDGNTPRTFEGGANQRRIEMSKRGISYFGYDVDGNKLNSGVDGPRHPFFGSAYVQSKFEYRDLVLNFGMRFERIDINEYVPDDLDSPSYDTKLDYIDESKLQRTKAEDYVLPRINFAFPVTDKTVFYAQYGKYVQMPELRGLILSVSDLSARVLPTTRSAYGFFGAITGFTAKPERTTQYEMGIRQSLTDNFAFTVTTFYKDYRDQQRWDKVYSTGTGDIAEGLPLFASIINNDFATSKGLELTLELRRTQRLSARINYTLSSAKGTGSDRAASRVLVSDADPSSTRYPTLIYSLNHNQPHRGSIMMDYRFPMGDGGPILQGLGANLLFTFNSGHGFTAIKEPLNLGQANPFNVGVRPLQDPRTRNPVEPLNSSSTPWTFNFDFNIGKRIEVGALGFEIYGQVNNVFDSRQVINVFPSTGTAEDDGWLRSPLAASFAAIPNYTAFYNAINIDNRWAYLNATNTDIYAAPRTIVVGFKLEY